MAFVGTILFFNPYIYQIAAAAAAPLAQILRWTAKFGGTGTGDIGNGVASDIYGNVYVGGNFTSNPVSFYSSNGAAFGTTFTNSGSNDALVVQYDTNGNVGWAARIQGAGNDQGLGIATDLGANVYACGTYGYPNASFYSSSGASYGTIANPANGQTQAYVVKYNSAGLIQWAARMTTSGTTNGCGTNGVATDSSGYVYTVGSFSCTTLNIYNAGVSGTLFGTLANSGGALNNDTMIVKYDTNGNVQWTARIGSVSQNDFGTSIAVDSGSNVYITEWGTGNPIVVYHANGATFQTISQTGSNDCILVKYNSAGTAQWVSRYYSSGFDITNGVAVDSSLNVYVTGVYNSPFTAYNSDGTAFSTTNFISATNGQTYLIKYNTSGFVQWVATSVNSASYNYSQGQGVVTDGSNVYSTGYYSGGTGLQVYNSSGSLATTLPNSGGIDGFITKYDTTGTVQWAYPVSGLGTDEGFAITVDINLNLYVTGSLTSNIMNVAYGAGQVVQTASGAQNGFLVKLALPSSTLNWATHVGGNGNDFGQAIASDLGSNVYVTGYYSSTSEAVYNSNGTTFGTLANAGTNDCFIVKYNTIGAAQWATHVGGTGGDIGYSIAVDSGSNVYVTGYYTSNPVTIYNSGGTTFGTLANAGSYNAFIVKYNTSGTAQWATRIGGTGLDFGQSIAVDSGLNVYVTGYYTPSPVTIYNSDGTSVGSFNSILASAGFTVKYNASGFYQWIYTSVSGANYAIAVDSRSNVYVAGSTSTNQNQTCVLFEDQSNNVLGSIPTSNVVGQAMIAKFTQPSLWAARIGGSTSNDYGFGIAIDSGGNICVVGSYNSNPLTAYNADGSSFSGTLATTGTNSHAFIVKYSTTGVVQWTSNIGGTNNNDYGKGIATDPGSNIYVTGYYASSPVTVFNAGGGTFGTLTNSGSFDVFVVKYNSAGTAQWATRIAGTSADQGNAIAADYGSNVYVTGTYSSNPLTVYNFNGTTFGTLSLLGLNNCFIVKYNTTGTAQWSAIIGGTSADQGNSIATDSSGSVCVAGQYMSNPVTIYNASGTTFGTLSNSGSYDAFIVKYNTTGAAQWATRIAGSASDIGQAITVDTNLNVYVTGYYQSNPVTIYNANGTTFGTFSGISGCFIVKYSTTGAVQWATRMIGGPNGGTTIGNSIATDSSGNVYVTGQFSVPDALMIYNSNGTLFGKLSCGVQTDCFIVKYNTNGIAQIAYRITGTLACYGLGIAADSYGSMYATGYHISNSISVCNQVGTALASLQNTNTNSSSDAFVVKIGAN